MFYQVKIPESQHSYLRFFWWPEGDLNQQFREYHMKVHLFGAVSSPSISNFALRHITEELDLSPAVSQAIKRNFYVDDCLCSVPTVETACETIKGLTDACSKRGFRLTKFCSNKIEVLNEIPSEERSKECKSRELEYDDLPNERTLGIEWSLERDVFGFTVELPDKPMTRRGILSLVCTIFDPLGFIAPFILPAKRILQELCKEKIGWDDNIAEPHKEKFKEWLQDVPMLEDVKLRRCLKAPEAQHTTDRQLHVFADASSYGYGAVAFLRTVSGECIHSAFLLGKARPAPLKATTIPRLELTAATVGVQMGRKLQTEFDTAVDSITYWTDSTTVLHYLLTRTKRLPIFVANRVQQILEFSEPKQWNYVPTELNPADIASRGLVGKNFNDIHKWLEGPEFLRQKEESWPTQPDLFNTASQPEEVEVCTTATTEVTEGPFDKLLKYYSTWSKMKGAVAVFITLKTILKNKALERKSVALDNVAEDAYKPFTTDCTEKAEHVILKYIQQKYFQEVIQYLAKTQTAQNHRGRGKGLDQIYRIDPIMVQVLIRVGGRLSKADLPEYSKHQILLPAKCHVTSVIIRHTHAQLAHAGRNHVLAKLREKFWIVAMNAAVRRIIYKCVWCRRQRRPCAEQKMADLPVCRIEPAPPFTSTGLDLFGPFLIKERRKELKRFGIIFTCMASRAIHLEPVNSLETDSFLNALQRFIARRGPVKQICCDNGTNFVGAANELRENAANIDLERVQSRLLHQDITWKFNPPAASHMGGAWERQIRSVRKVLSSLVHDNGTRLDEECFHTLLCEVENIINSRPLTAMSEDIDDDHPLTPNQILTLKPTSLPPPGNFEREDLYAKKRWRRVQYLSHLFWTRWKREYLVQLQQRQKWLYPQRNFKEKNVVLVKDENTPRYRWTMARVIEAEEDKSGTVRNLKIKTATSELRRPVHKLVLLLPVEEQ